MKRTLALLTFFALCMTILTACGCGNDNATVTRDEHSVVVAMGVNSEPEAGFDPAYGWGAGEHVHEPLIQSTLTVTTTDLEITYDLATDLAVSDDGLTWTVTIRDDVFFTDGAPLTAHDVAFTYNTVKATSSVNDFTMLQSAEAVDDTTVLFHMEHPYSIWPYTMAVVGIVPSHAYGPDYGQNPIGSGRYMLQQWDRGQQAILVANPDYYGDEILMKKVTVLFMTEDAAFAAAKAGQVDLAYTSATFSDQTVRNYTLTAYDTVDNRGINLPTVSYDGIVGNDVTCDLTIRQAINIGLDRQAMIDYVLNGYGSPAYSVCDGMPWYNEGNKVDHDFDGAIEILENGGWVLGEDGIRVKDGIRAQFTLFYPADDSVRQALAAECVNQLKALGIGVETRGVGWDTAYDEAQSQPLVWGWGAHTPMELYNIYHTVGQYATYSPYASEVVDDYMDQALSATDLEESYQLWQSAQAGQAGTIAEDLPWIWLVNIDHLYWVQDDLTVTDQKIHPHGSGWSIVNNVDQWQWAAQ